MDPRKILQAVVRGAVNLNSKERGNEGFQVQQTRIEEGEGNVNRVILTPFGKEQGKIVVVHFKREGELTIICISDAALEFAKRMKEARELIHTSASININGD